MTAVLFGSISTLADTSELQREAFNRAFEAHGLDWRWDRDDYRETLTGNGGESRIAAYAAERGEDVDAAAVHATKSQIFQENLATTDVAARPGVVDVIAAARADGAKVALVTTTSPQNITALLEALAPAVSSDDFDLVVDVTNVEDPKPAPDAYRYALTTLGISPDGAVAIEDNVGGVDAAVAAGVAVVAFPNENTRDHDFSAAATEVESVDYASLAKLA